MLARKERELCFYDKMLNEMKALDLKEYIVFSHLNGSRHIRIDFTELS